ncbi:MAG: acetate--CoA ligase [Pseudomonadales bacterium]|nr:acetate--CoA ligase [Pseudomonadales bacterium]TNC88659.1 MAG: acetate--CoA ligase [Alcanivorax sp.]HAG96915.1 acetate--CoA ligase [Gammaproteobacteria bacterium]MBI27784.1 acetate--CoA ligase [Pseudomonadales bacterium]HAU14816.1 acetate--CoA ligase [Gammaproteobacteria bacterium]
MESARCGMNTAEQAKSTIYQQYLDQYTGSVQNAEGFWQAVGQRIDWIKPFTRVKDVSFQPGDVHIRWYEDGTLNASANCVDRHLASRADQPAIIWEPDTPGATRIITYQQLHDEVCRSANAMKALGVGKGDRVMIYMPMIPEAVFSMLACARLGAIHSVVFGGFSPEALAGRIEDCGAKLVVTADEGLRGGRPIALKHNVDAALAHPSVNTVEHVLVVRHTGGEVQWNDERDVDYAAATRAAANTCLAQEVNAEDPLFILYTSGSTGKPKGVLHTTGGYMVYASFTHQQVFDYRPGEVYWCTADIGWITGHTYLVYGPLANGATVVMCEGLPNFPDETRLGQVIDAHGVAVLYTAPTAIRSFMAKGEAPFAHSSRRSLRIVATAGEPINPAAWQWYHDVIGAGQAQVIDTWWQTETGGVMITTLPGSTVHKPGAATQPFYGICPQLVDNEGHVLTGAAEGNLVITDSWPGQMRTLWGDHERFVQTYFTTFPGKYCTGDGARRDEDGDYWITGRVDDVINVSGHRLGTAEIESALVAHHKVAEAAVVGCPHDIKGQGIYVYVTVNEGIDPSEELLQELRNWVRREIGPVASPDWIQFAPGLPKTRSGKIMRRILRKIAANEFDQLGDVSTLADPAVVPQLVDSRVNR